MILDMFNDSNIIEIIKNNIFSFTKNSTNNMCLDTSSAIIPPITNSGFYKLSRTSSRHT